MLRWLYIQFIWHHPAPFRWRFGDDMLDDFERAPNRARLRYFADTVADHGDEISASEVDQAAPALKKLDRNHDAYLTANELVPFEMAVRAGIR